MKSYACVTIDSFMCMIYIVCDSCVWLTYSLYFYFIISLHYIYAKGRMGKRKLSVTYFTLYMQIGSLNLKLLKFLRSKEVLRSSKLTFVGCSKLFPTDWKVFSSGFEPGTLTQSANVVPSELARRFWLVTIHSHVGITRSTNRSFLRMNTRHM